MATNTLTGLIPTIWTAMRKISRERVSGPQLVYLNSELKRAALDQTISYPIVPQGSAGDITPSNVLPSGQVQTIPPGSMTLDKARRYFINWQGEEGKKLKNGGMYFPVFADQFSQGIRTLVNEIEVDICAEYKAASRAVGIAGTAPFGADLSEISAALRILEDNGAPQDGQYSAIINSAAAQNLRDLNLLLQANTSGSKEMLETGHFATNVFNLLGVKAMSSGGVTLHTNGTGTSYRADDASDFAVGIKDIHVEAGTGTIVAGDVITWAGDVNNYVITSGFAGDGDGDIDIGRPGLREILLDNVAMTIGNDYTPNMVFHKDAIHLVTRLPELPTGPNGKQADIALDRTTITDPVSGLTFEVSMYFEYRQLVVELAIVWGVGTPNEEHNVVLMG